MNRFCSEVEVPTIGILLGWAFTGKTALVEKLKKVLNVHFVNIDDVRFVAIGIPHPHPNISKKLMDQDILEMTESYRLLCRITDWHLEHNRSLIITATFSRSVYWKIFRPMLRKHRHAKIKIIQCLPVGDTPKKVAHIMKRRKFGENYNSAVNSPERYFEVKHRFKKPPLPFQTILTWGSGNSIEESARQAAEYILA